MLHKLKILYFSLIGECIKLLYRIGIFYPKDGINRSEKRAKQVVVSLTSYGRRVSSVLYYTLCSLLRQSYKPDVIVLWLNRELWNDDNLPGKIKRLREKGVTIRYADDLRSYTKLVPALEAYPEALIITVDDDLFYKVRTVERLVKAYEENPDGIYSLRAHKIKTDNGGNILPYNEWRQDVTGDGGKGVFPLGVGGVIYQKRLLHNDVLRKDLFKELSPNADDIWFFFMEVLAGTPATVLPGEGRTDYPIDAFYQHFHKGSSLAESNCSESQNDVQFKAVMQHYGLTARDLA